MRKIAWIIAAALGLSLAGCGGGGGSGSGTNSSTTLNAPVGASSPAPASGTNTSAPNVLATDASAVPTPVGPGNTIAVTVTGTSIHNQPMVSVTICPPGSSATTNCAIIPNVIVDTESFGLRLVSSAIPAPTFSALTPETASGLPLAECALFGSGYAWGTVHYANVAISGETATNVPIHVIGDTTLTTPAPTECQVGRQLVTTTDLGANGILGIGVSPTDCGTACVNGAVSTFYYTNAGTGTAVPLNGQITNPVSLFGQDSNGVILEMAQVSDTGSATAQGTLVFGIDTQANNMLYGTGATLMRTNGNGDFTSTYNGTTQTKTFFDSGSTVMFFPDLSIPVSSTSGYYIPTTTVGRSSTLVGAIPTSVSLGFNIANGATLNASGNNAFNNLGIYMTRQFDFGMPFFYGRHVYYGISGKASTGGGTGPYVAYVSS
ncbi:DUF3443 family protein [Paraburkholderia sp. 1N]|uniref:DUF3443 family protein n=1 Tax=Paraburkholderia solitsugae TaxID=2675748 RepID=A0ABX2BVM8_9BURK|nr:DUF3443 family protein [Paraburkholderia solitsugae]NPT44005.1 DUF3443 family protein [Paraburkholderia solitsugae]